MTVFKAGLTDSLIVLAEFFLHYVTSVLSRLGSWCDMVIVTCYFISSAVCHLGQRRELSKSMHHLRSTQCCFESAI